MEHKRGPGGSAHNLEVETREEEAAERRKQPRGGVLFTGLSVPEGLFPEAVLHLHLPQAPEAAKTLLL